MVDKKRNSQMASELKAVGQQWRSEAPASDDFYAKLEARLGEEAEKPVSVIPGSFTQWMIGSGIAACLIIAIALTMSMNSSDPYGALRIADGEVSISGIDSSQAKSLKPGSVVVTSSVGGALLSLDQGRIHVFAEKETKLEILSEDTIQIEKGNAWVSIRKNSGRFVVNLPDGVIVATGTSFAIKTEDTDQVFLASGQVSATNDFGQESMVPGNMVNFTNEQAPNLVHFEQGDEPEWVNKLYKDYNTYFHRAYYRSVPVN